jgi:hypothetical protein
MRAPSLRVDEPGIAVIPARVALDFVRDLVGDEVVLDARAELRRSRAARTPASS